MKTKLTLAALLAMLLLLLAACGAAASAGGVAPPPPLPPSPYNLTAPNGWNAPRQGTYGDFDVEGYTEFVVLRTPDETSWLFEVPGPTLTYPGGNAVFTPQHGGEITYDEERALAEYLMSRNPSVQQITLSDGSQVTR